MPAAILLIANGALLVLALALAIVLVHAGAVYGFNYGISAVQEKMKWRILKCLLSLMILGAGAAALNIVSTFLG